MDRAMAADLTQLPWNPRYQERDWEVVDYLEYEIPGVRMKLRGPAVDPTSGQYFSAIGAAQTHGTLVQKAFPQQVAEAFKLPVLNFGYPAANPGYFARQRAIIDYVNRGSFLILQVMAARAEPNRFNEAQGYCETVRYRETGEILPAIITWKRLYDEHPGEAASAVRESREAWIEDNKLLLSQVKVPVIMLWISHERYFKDRIDFVTEFSTAEKFMPLRMHFPQFVDAGCVDVVSKLCGELVVCDSRRNAGPLLISRFRGEPVVLDSTLIDPRYKGVTPPMTHNSYYPSQEMHDDAAGMLIDAVNRMVGKHPSVLPSECNIVS